MKDWKTSGFTAGKSRFQAADFFERYVLKIKKKSKTYVGNTSIGSANHQRHWEYELLTNVFQAK